MCMACTQQNPNWTRPARYHDVQTGFKGLPCVRMWLYQPYGFAILLWSTQTENLAEVLKVYLHGKYRFIGMN